MHGRAAPPQPKGMLRMHTRPYFLLLLASCGSATEPEQQPAPRFGAITAVVDGKRWASTHPLDAVIAAYDPQGGQLTIRATRILGAGLQDMSLSLCPVPGQAGYSFGSEMPRAFGHFVSSGQDRNGGTVAHASGLYSSLGAIGDTLVLTTLDLSGGLIEGFFRMTVAHAETQAIRIEGRFSGHVRRSYLPFCDR